MAQASYSFLDVAALAEVRERFAAGDALVILSGNLEEVIWANGPGALLFGHADVETILGAEAPLGPAAKRQIAATAGFPAIGRDRALLVRVAIGMSSRALPLLASAVTLPDGEKAILLAHPVAGAALSAQAVAARAIGGFAAAGHFLAFIDAAGAVEAASAGFDRLGLRQEALAAMAREASDGGRIVKRMAQGRRGLLPAGLARLTDDRLLLVVIDEGHAEGHGEDEDEPAAPEAADEASAEAAGETAAPEQADAEPRFEGQPAAAREIWYLGSDHDPLAIPEDAPVAEEPEWAEAGEAEPAAAKAFVKPTAEPEPEAEVAPAATPDSGAEASDPGVLSSDTSESDISEPDISDWATSEQPVSEPAVASRQPEALETEAHETKAPEPQDAEPSAPAPPQRASGPVRFVWRTDAEGKFSQISPEFSLAVGEVAADIVGRRFQDVASAFGLDPDGDIAGLLARRDT
ncbi:MAG: PAS domain-containing sensor histidine kinase, partial [Pseudomonadota bacterium]|nr:PAS domain-containing sensor histidine kinase [Pseudomonadota bacterium]